MRNAVDYRWNVNEFPVDIMLKESEAEPCFIQEDRMKAMLRRFGSEGVTSRRATTTTIAWRE